MRACVYFNIDSKKSIQEIATALGPGMIEIAIMDENFTDFKENKRMVELFSMIYKETREKINICERQLQYISNSVEIIFPVSRLDDVPNSNGFSRSSGIEKTFLLQEELIEKYQSKLENHEKYFSVLNSLLNLLSYNERDLLDIKYLNPGEVQLSNYEICLEIGMKHTAFYEFQKKTYAKLHKLIWNFGMIEFFQINSRVF